MTTPNNLNFSTFAPWQKAITRLLAHLFVDNNGFPMDTLDHVKILVMEDNDLIPIRKRCMNFAAIIITAQMQSTELMPSMREALN